jgi:hypothetical protein
MTSARVGNTQRFSIWRGGDELIVQLVLRVAEEARWVEATISQPQTNVDRVELEPVAEVIVTLKRSEYNTIGMIDANVSLVADAVYEATRRGRSMLRQVG